MGPRPLGRARPSSVPVWTRLHKSLGNLRILASPCAAGRSPTAWGPGPASGGAQQPQQGHRLGARPPSASPACPRPPRCRARSARVSRTGGCDPSLRRGVRGLAPASGPALPGGRAGSPGRSPAILTGHFERRPRGAGRDDQEQDGEGAAPPDSGDPERTEERPDGGDQRDADQQRPDQADRIEDGSLGRGARHHGRETEQAACRSPRLDGRSPPCSMGPWRPSLDPDRREEHE